jgi:O-antigen/teichoic acid export membrane protein
LACWTVPHSILSVLIPEAYSSTATLLKYTSVSGAAIGLINCLTTAHQARGRFVSAVRILAPAAILQPFLLIWLGRAWGITAFSIGLVSLSLVTLAAISWDSRRWLQAVNFRLTPTLAAVILLSLAAALVHSPAVWIVAISGVTACLALAAKRMRPTIAEPTSV